MKKILFYCFAFLAINCIFASCSSDDDGSAKHSVEAQIASEGTYSGTWTRSDAEDKYSGYISLSATDSSYCSNIRMFCADLSLDNIAVTNIWWSNEGFQFVNQTTDPTFAGRIDENGNLTTSFTITVKEGRQSNTYVYNFVGKKE